MLHRLKVLKRITSLNPFGSVRDISVFARLFVPFVFTSVILAKTGFVESRGAVAVAIGSFLGMCVTMGQMLPVRDRLPHSRKAVIQKRIDELKYIQVDSNSGDKEVFVPNKVHWRRWDSNRIIVKEQADGSLELTYPLCIAQRLDVESNVSNCV